MGIRSLELIGLMLYAGEGAKSGKTVDFTNANPLLISAFVTYLRRCCQIDENRLRFYLYCFDNQNVFELIDYWCTLLKVSPKQFTKPYVRINNPSKARKTSIYGVLHVRYSDKKLLIRILDQINTALKNIG